MDSGDMYIALYITVSELLRKLQNQLLGRQTTVLKVTNFSKIGDL